VGRNNIQEEEEEEEVEQPSVRRGRLRQTVKRRDGSIRFKKMRNVVMYDRFENF
jgi:hypothetical protein